MTETAERLERLIASEVGECCPGDVAARLDALESFASTGPTDREADLSALSALGDDTRHRIVRLLAAADGPLCVCEITPVVDVSDSATSHALADLTDAGLVTRHKEGTWRYYEPTERATRLLDALDSTREVTA